MSSKVDQIRAINDGYINEYIKNHKPSYKFEQFPNVDGNLVLACMDPRSNPNEFWGFDESTVKAGVLRNAGGRVTEDVLRTLRVGSGIFGYGTKKVNAIAVVHHVDCGMTNFTNEQIGALMAKHNGLDEKLTEEAKGLDYGAIDDPFKTVREDMQKVRDDPFLPKDLGVIGYVWNSLNNSMTEVGTL